MTKAKSYAINPNNKIIICNESEVKCSYKDCEQKLSYGSTVLVCSISKDIFCVHCRFKSCFCSNKNHEDILGVLKKEVPI